MENMNNETNDTKNNLNKAMNYVKKNKNNIVTIAIIIFFLITLIGSYIIIRNNYGENQNGISVQVTKKEKNKVKELTIESGDKLPTIDDYFTTKQNETFEIKYFQDKIEVPKDRFSYELNGNLIAKGIGVYDVELNSDKYLFQTKLNIKDTTPPEIKLDYVEIASGDTYEADDFLSLYTDNSGSAEHRSSFKNESDKHINEIGFHNVIVTVCDQSNNCIDDKTVLKVIKGISGSSSSHEIAPPSKPGAGKYTDEYKKVIVRELNHYGTKETYYREDLIRHYQNGVTETLKKGKTKMRINYDGFKATTKQLENEATIASRSSISKSAQKTMLEDINRDRLAAGEKPLEIDERLNVLATIRAMELAYSNNFEHKRPNGDEWETIFKEAQYYARPFEYEQNKTKRFYGENLACHFKTDAAASKGLHDSPDHYENIVNPYFRRVGIGKFTFNSVTYWAHLYAS